MDKINQRLTLHNVYNTLLTLQVQGKDSEVMTGIKQAVGQVHDAIAQELKEEKEFTPEASTNGHVEVAQ